MRRPAVTTPPYPKTRKRNLVGHLVGVPFDEDKSAVCVVLWQSSQFKNVIVLGISDVHAPHQQYPNRLERLVSLIDTGANVIRSGFWHLGPSIEVSIPPEISTRIVADGIWCDDVRIREATRDDRGVVPVLKVAGMGVVHSYLKFLADGEPNSEFFRKDQMAMKSLLERCPIRFPIKE